MSIHEGTSTHESTSSQQTTPEDALADLSSTTVVVVTHRPEAVPADMPVLRIGEPR